MSKFYKASDLASNGLRRFVDAVGLKSKIDPIAFYGYEGQEVKTSSKRLWKVAGICPFHQDREAGSFYINSETGAYNCFACDHKGGDIIAFTMEKYVLSFPEAVKKLVSEWRVV